MTYNETTTLLDVARYAQRFNYGGGLHRPPRHFWTCNLGAGGTYELVVDEQHDHAEIHWAPYDSALEEQTFSFVTGQTEELAAKLQELDDMTDSIQ